MKSAKNPTVPHTSVQPPARLLIRLVEQTRPEQRMDPMDDNDDDDDGGGNVRTTQQTW